MTVNEKYNLWLTLDEDTKNELESVNDEKRTGFIRTCLSVRAACVALWAQVQTV